MRNINSYELITYNKKAVLKKQKTKILNELWLTEMNFGLERVIEKAKRLKNNEMIEDVVEFLFKRLIVKENFTMERVINLLETVNDPVKKDRIILKFVDILSERYRFNDLENILNTSGIYSSPGKAALTMNYASLNFLEAGEVDKSIIFLIQSIKKTGLIKNNKKLRKSVSIEINKTINKLSNIESEKRNNILIKKLWYAYYLLLYINKKLLYASINVSVAAEGSGSDIIYLGNWNISKIECSIGEKKEKGHNIFIFDFRSEIQRLDEYEYIAIAYQGELIAKVSLENCDYDVTYLYEDFENEINLPNDIEIFVIPEEKENKEDRSLFGFDQYKK